MACLKVTVIPLSLTFHPIISRSCKLPHEAFFPLLCFGEYLIVEDSGESAFLCVDKE